ncbi:hypothetical_protein [Candidozyma auris]|uniref:hypothetical_protein n=1 Tax=Candidozyma auris TaxID=498019 RepID=UPI000D2611BF|nr:hypothetical_protein [[Candida] auris]QEO21709.1 hypothetical_protein [[Candida] auris]GBL47792.1 hypothetical protein CAJCM15448_00660 [[Candida] auris]
MSQVVLSNNDRLASSKDDSFENKKADPEKTDNVESDVDDNALAVGTKSFGIRETEIIIDLVNTLPLKFAFYFSIFVCFYIINLEGAATGVFVGYATDSYKKHSLMSTIGIINGVVASASLPFFARLSDTYGRWILLIIAQIARVVGVIVQSQATDVQKYAGGAVIKSFGHAGTMVLLQVSLADSSTLRWRLLAIGLSNLQTVINTWSSGNVVDTLLTKYTWQFGIAMWAFVTPLCFCPYFFLYGWLTWKAHKTEAWRHLKQDRQEHFIESVPQAAQYYSGQLADEFWLKRWTKLAYYNLLYHGKLIFWYVDFIGCLLIAVVLGLILVPLTLAGGTSNKWKQAKIIVPLVLGVCMIPVFIVWETKLSPRPMIPFKVMKNRGIWSALVISVLHNFSSAIVEGYAYPVLFVGMNASRVVATRTPQLSSFVNGITVTILGFVVAKVRRSKAFILFGAGVFFIAMGLFIHFRGSNDGLRDKYFRDGVAIGMCIMGFAEAFLNRLVFVSAQACTNHEYMAIVMACFAAFYRVGHALGACVSGAIWTQRMYHEIEQKMEQLDVNTSLAKPAYQAPYTFIQKHHWGTPPRRAISMAYAVVQRALSITGLCLCVPLLVCVFFLRDHRLADKQNLDDQNMDEAEIEKGKSTADRTKSEVAFTNDKDYILIFLRRLVRWRSES